MSVCKKCRFAGSCTMEDVDVVQCDKLTADKRKRQNAARRAREQTMRDCGLVKVRGAQGGVYWE